MDQNNEPGKVEFETDSYQVQKLYQERTSPSKIIDWIIKYSGGIIKDESQASYVVIGFVIISIIISGFLLFGGNSRSQVRFTPGHSVPVTGPTGSL